LAIYIEIYQFFNKILRFLKIEKSTEIFLNISPSTFGSLEKIVLARVFKGQSAFFSYSPFCVQAKIIKLVGLKNGGRLSPINLVTFAGTQNGE
jgi:hypothetical protein